MRRFECSECHHRPWETSETFRTHTKWTERIYHQVRAEFLGGCPGKKLARRYGLSGRTVFRWTFERSRGGRPRKLGRAIVIFFFSSRRRHTRSDRDWSSDVCSSDLYNNVPFHQGISAEILAERWKLDRRQLDEFSLESHKRAAKATEQGWFNHEILPVTDRKSVV